MVAVNPGNQGNRQTQNAGNQVVSNNVGQNGFYILQRKVDVGSTRRDRHSTTTEHHDYLSYAPEEELEQEGLTSNYLFMAKLKPTLSNMDMASMYNTSGIFEEHMAWQTYYCIMEEGMSIQRRRKSVPGMNSSEREMERGHPAIDLIALLENGILKSFYSFGVRCHTGVRIDYIDISLGCVYVELGVGVGRDPFNRKLIWSLSSRSLRSGLFRMNYGVEMDIIVEFFGPSRWKELSKESGSKILSCGDGSRWKAFKPIASLIA
nr:hypothetical protein [Tanacetum cinerariifolium]